MKFLLLDIDYRSEEFTTVRLFGKALSDGKWKPAVLLDSRHQPYIYVLAPKPADAEKELEGKSGATETGQEVKAVRFEHVQRNVGGAPRDVLKVYFKRPGDVPIYRELVRNLGYEPREDDIPFVRRYMIDLGLEQSVLLDVKAKEAKKAEGLENAYEVEDIKRSGELTDLIP
ncbi:MAG: hypothetical protein ABH829_02610 [archaeon]